MPDQAAKDRVTAGEGPLRPADFLFKRTTFSLWDTQSFPASLPPCLERSRRNQWQQIDGGEDLTERPEKKWTIRDGRGESPLPIR